MSGRSVRATITLSATLLLLISLAVSGQPNGDGGTAVPVISVRPFSEILTETLAGVKATTELKQYEAKELSGLVGSKADIYREYHVMSAASRWYGKQRIDVFQAENAIAAFGLFSYSFPGHAPDDRYGPVGSGSSATEDGLVFWQGRFFIHITSAAGHFKEDLVTSAARGVSDILGDHPTTPPVPALLESLPESAGQVARARYFLGPRSLGEFVRYGGEMFTFVGDAQAAMTEYAQPAGAGTPRPLKLVIVEYHTPQFAYDALARAKSFVRTLAEDEMNHIVLRREGNYIIEASGVVDRDEAERLVAEVKYPYKVKWLRNPLLPTRDPFGAQKAAQIILSSFGIIGLLFSVGILGGLVFGTVVFIKRRKQQREVFTDAGGMQRLDIDPILGVASAALEARGSTGHLLEGGDG